MGSATPEAAIRAFLTARSLVLTRRQAPGTVGWTAETSTGGLGAMPESIRFVRAHRLPGREVHAVSLELPNGRFWRYICHAEQDAGGDWQLAGASGGSSDGLPARGQPWTHLGGGGWPKRFYAGGYMDDQSVARVRLTSANGVVLDDTIDRGVALFIADGEVAVPIRAELYDARGTLIGEQVAFQP